MDAFERLIIRRENPQNEAERRALNSVGYQCCHYASSCDARATFDSELMRLYGYVGNAPIMAKNAVKYVPTEIDKMVSDRMLKHYDELTDLEKRFLGIRGGKDE